MRTLLFVFLSSLSFGATLSIPNQSPVGWQPGVNVGVPGGIAQYRPGGANARTNLRNAVTEFSADNTGVNPVNGTLSSAISSLNHNDVLFLPYGLYRTTGGINVGTKRITIRGSGDGALSTSSVTIGTGTKTFTVADDLEWAAGIGTRIWHVTDRHKWMQGTVTSYSGTTLTVNVTSTSGHTDTLDFWTVGQTVFFRDGSHEFINQTGAGDASLGFSTAITGSPSVGATSITVADGSGLYVFPNQGFIDMLPETNGEVYNHGPFLRQVHRQYVWVTNVTGNTVTLAQPLLFDLPTGRSPKIWMRDLAPGYNVGYEDFAVFGGSAKFFDFAGMNGCWMYHIQCGFHDSYLVFLQFSTNCEIAFCFIGGTDDDGSSSAAALSMGGVNNLLIRDSIIKNGLFTEGVPDFNNVFLRTIGLRDGWLANHGGGSHYRLFENCIIPYIHFDGYHGGTKYDTVFKTWLDGSSVGLPGQGFLIHNRYGRYHNAVGNILGKTGVAIGLHSLGNPNIGNSDNSGETANSTLWVETSGVSGSRFRHLDPSGFSRLAGTLTAKVGTRATVTLASHTLTDLSDPYTTSDEWWHLVWGSLSNDALQASRRYMSIIRASSSGANIVLDDSANVQGSALPDVGTPMWIHTAEFGTQELDGAVEYSMFKKENYAYGSGGSAGSITDPTADTLPDSLAEVGQPADWPSGLTWPPAISPDDPDSLSYSVIPAGLFLTTGSWSAAEVVAGTATVAGSTTVTGTLTVP